MSSRPASRSGPDLTVAGWAAGLLLAAVLPQYLVAAVSVEIRQDFPFSATQFGIAIGVSFAFAAAISPTAGRAVAWIGVRRGVLAGAGLVTVSSVLLITVADSAGAVIGLMAVNGLGAGVASPSLSTILAKQVAPGRQGTAFGIFTSAPQVAAVAAGLALPLVAEPLGWRVTFIVPVLIGAASTMALLRRELPSAPTGPSESRLDRRRLPLSVHVIAVSAALVSTAGIGMRTFVVIFAVSVGLGASTAGLLLAVTGLMAIASRVGFGALGDRRPEASLHRAAGLMSLCAIGFVLMAIGGHAAIVVGILLAGGLGWGWQAPLSHAVIVQNPDATSAAVGMQMTGFFAGAVAGPPIVGLLATGGSYSVAWVSFACLSLLAAALAVIAQRLAAGPAGDRLNRLDQAS